MLNLLFILKFHIIRTMSKRNYKSVFKDNIYPISILHVRYYSKSRTTFFPESRLPATPVAPFLQLTDDVRSFIDQILLRNLGAIDQLNHTIQDNNNNIRDLYEGGNLNNNIAHIGLLNNLIERDMNVRQEYLESVDLLNAIYEGEDPPIHNMSAWLDLRNDLDNNEDITLQSFREYVREVIDTHIRDQFNEMVMDAIRIGRENRLENESRDNSQYSDELDESNSTLESDSDVYHSADTHLDESSNNNSYSSDDSFATGQDLNSNDNLSDTNNEFNSDIDSYHDSHEFNQDNDSNVSNTDMNQSSDENKSDSDSDKKYITDDALDISDTLHMFYDESSVKNQSTVDFVLQKQQEEMPDIMDSDGGE